MGGCLFEAGRLLTFSAFTMGAYSNKYGTSKTPLSISFNIQTRAPGSRSLKIGYALFFNPLLSVWISDETMPVVFDILVFKLINYT